MEWAIFKVQVTNRILGYLYEYDSMQLFKNSDGAFEFKIRLYVYKIIELTSENEIISKIFLFQHIICYRAYYTYIYIYYTRRKKLKRILPLFKSYWSASKYYIINSTRTLTCLKRNVNLSIWLFLQFSVSLYIFIQT